jgi:hypothetical protein
MAQSLLIPCTPLLEGDVLSSTNQVAPEELTKDTSRHWRPNVSQKTSAARSHFAPLTLEEKITYRKWRGATLSFYGAFAFVMAAFLITIGPPDPSTKANDKNSYSALASIGQRNPR